MYPFLGGRGAVLTFRVCYGNTTQIFTKAGEDWQLLNERHMEPIGTTSVGCVAEMADIDCCKLHPLSSNIMMVQAANSVSDLSSLSGGGKGVVVRSSSHAHVRKLENSHFTILLLGSVSHMPSRGLLW